MRVTKIVVGVDFSPESLRAAAHAMEVAHHTGGAITLVHVRVMPPSMAERTDFPWTSVRDAMAADRRRLEELRERMSGQGVEVSHVVHDGYADTGVAEAAAAIGAELVVVGTHGRSGVRRLMLGSVAEKTVRLAVASVLVVRGDPVPGGYRHVVVGTDYSPMAERALERAFELAARHSDLRLVHAWSAPYLAYELDARSLDSLHEAAEIEARAERERLLALPRPPGVDLRLDVVEGAPFEALDRFSADADLIVVGSHGRRGARRFFLGSVAEATVRHARCSVLVAR